MAGPYTSAAWQGGPQGVDPFATLGQGLVGLQQGRLDQARFKADLGLRQQALDQQGDQFHRRMGFDETVHKDQMGVEGKRLGIEQHKADTSRILANAQALHSQAQTEGAQLENDGRFITLQQEAVTARRAMENDLKQQMINKNFNINTDEGWQAAIDSGKFDGLLDEIIEFDAKLTARLNGGEARLHAVGPGGHKAIMLQTPKGERALGSPDGKLDNAPVFSREDRWGAFRARSGSNSIDQAEALAPYMDMAAERINGAQPGQTQDQVPPLAGGAAQGLRQENPQVPQQPAKIDTQTRQNIALLTSAPDAAARHEQAQQIAGKANAPATLEGKQAAQSLDQDNAKDLLTRLNPEGSGNFTRSGIADNKYEVLAGESADKVAENIVRYTAPIIDSPRILPLLRNMGYSAKSYNDAKRYTRDPQVRAQLQEALVRFHEDTTRDTGWFSWFNDLDSNEAIPIPNAKQMAELGGKSSR